MGNTGTKLLSEYILHVQKQINNFISNMKTTIKQKT